MTRLDPSLRVNRLRIERGPHVAYDELFHPGVNIVRGENSSGKSTILNFLFYVLGGDLSDWSEIARLCTRVNAEVVLNGKVATLSREILREAGQPMDIYGGPMEEALRASRSEWTRYPYKRSTTRESFSQAVFRLLNLPEVSNEVSGNITIHQLLRLLYADQLSPVEHLFKFERFDPPTTRAAVGRLLCGAFDNQMYQNELQIRDLDKELGAVSAEYRSLLMVLGRSQEGMTLSWITSQRQVLERRQQGMRQEIARAEQQVFVTGKGDELTLKAQETAYTEVQEQQRIRGALQDELDALGLAVEDSAAFIASLEQKLKALSDADLVAEHLGNVEFQSCPSCLTPIEKFSAHACHLCKTPFENEQVKKRIVALINDTALQLKQSQTLQTRRQIRFKSVEQQLTDADQTWRAASARLQATRQLPTTELQESLRALHRQAGYLDREIEDLERKTSLVKVVEDLSRRKGELNQTIGRLRDDNAARLAEQERRLSKAYTAIADEIRSLLQRDLRRQDAFENPREIQFDFGANTITVDGISYFSASSRAILKSAFFLGMLSASLKNSFFRHPRFLMLDTIEDKGMEAARSQNFQRLIVEVSASTKVAHQIIYATAMIAPELDRPEYTIGRPSNGDHPSLEIGRSS